MLSIDPVVRLTSTYGVEDLRAFLTSPGPFATVIVPSPSGTVDADHRFEVRWRNARAAIEDDWPAELLDELAGALSQVGHQAGEAVAIVQSAGGGILVEPLAFAVDRPVLDVGPVPRLVPIVESRQRSLPHLVIVTDRTGAEILGVTGLGSGDDTIRSMVDGETLHIHRGHPGGWSQRRYQQRAENRWSQNADEVVAASVTLAEVVEPAVVAIAGDVRARSLVTDSLIIPSARIEVLDEGSPEGITDAVATLVADQHARLQVEIAHLFGERLANDRAVQGEAVLDALAEGRIETLLVHDDGSSGPLLGDGSARLVDHSVAAALRTGAAIVVMPSVAVLDGPVAGLTRW